MPESSEQKTLNSAADSRLVAIRKELNDVYQANQRLADDYDAAEEKIRELESLLAHEHQQHQTEQNQLKCRNNDATQQIERLTSQLSETKNRCGELEQQLAESDRQLEGLSQTVDGKERQIRELNSINESLQDELKAAKEENESLRSKFLSQDEQTQQLRRTNEQLIRQEQSRECAANDQTLNAQKLEKTIAALRTELAQAQQTAATSSQLLESERRRLEGLQSSNQQLADEISKTRRECERLGISNEHLIAERGAHNGELVSLTRQVDNLADAIKLLSEQLQSARGEIREVRQTHRIAAAGTPENALAAKSSTASKGSGSKSRTSRKRAKDLTCIEGIGPKIRDILSAANIHSFADLASTDAESIREILVAAGPRFKSHHPDTWPEQAELAASEKWAELDALQEKLKGGRRG
tara:strand:- start:11821 stop:13059 length:1239 start_codon:yes stop_codon:yes gene_type:complete